MVSVSVRLSDDTWDLLAAEVTLPAALDLMIATGDGVYIVNSGTREFIYEVWNGDIRRIA